MNKKMTKWVLATIIGLALLSCNKNVRIEPAEVVTPRNEINTETLESYKNSLLGRPIVMPMSSRQSSNVSAINLEIAGKTWRLH